MRHSFAKANANRAIGEFTQGITDLLDSGNSENVYRALSGIRDIKKLFGHLHNYFHTVGMLAAKAFLESEFPEIPWQQIEFAEHANRKGRDLRIPEFKIVAELKTTEPCGKSKAVTALDKFGPQHKKNMENDLGKLSAPEYAGFKKYMFLTSSRAYHCLIREYRAGFPDIWFVLLRQLPEVSKPISG